MSHPVAELLAFAGIMALGQFSPGPDMLLLTRTALAEGGRAGVFTALGIATGLALHGALAVCGMAILLDRHPFLRTAMMVLAAAYLIWLGLMLLRASVNHSTQTAGSDASAMAAHRTPYLRGLWCNLLNPKVIVFLAAVTAPFLKGEHAPGWPVALWAVIAIQGGLLWSLWAVLLQWQPLRKSYERAKPVIDGMFGIGLILLAARLLWK